MILGEFFSARMHAGKRAPHALVLSAYEAAHKQGETNRKAGIEALKQFEQQIKELSTKAGVKEKEISNWFAEIKEADLLAVRNSPIER